MIEALLSMFRGTELWETVLSVFPVFEKTVGIQVNIMQAQNGKNATSLLLCYINVAGIKKTCLMILNHHCYTARRIVRTCKTLKRS